MRARAPYGSWRSPLTVEAVAAAGQVQFAYAGVEIDEDTVFWLEGRPGEAGRTVLVARRGGAAPVDVTPAGFNVRTRVHEYGGGALFRHGETFFFSNFDDGRLYRQDGVDGSPRPITPAPDASAALRYADGSTTPDGTTIVCVREAHEGSEVRNELVALAADGSLEPLPLASGNDFYAAPRISPDGRRIAWTTWNHPQMPFEGCELWAGALEDGVSVRDARRLAGGARESIFQPEWSPEGVLHFVSDRTGWSNLYRERDGSLEPLAPTEAEFGAPQWVLGQTRYAFLPGDRIACIVTRNAISRIGVLDGSTGDFEELDLPYVHFASLLRNHGTRVACVAASATEAPAVLELDVDTGAARVVARSADTVLDDDSIARPEPIEFATEEGRIAHAFFYAPTNAGYEAPEDELPPLRVLCHGGPTSHSPPMYVPTVQFWTTRGFAVVDVNYGGSTGYGREYRERLRGRWGEVDVADCAAVVRHLAESGRADPRRATISGGSAGGYTTLCALAFRDVFAAGMSSFGVVDLETFRETTHKFEAHYDEYLVGRWPDDAELYRRRSPIHAAHRISAPLLVLQGLDDAIVPPSQAEQLVAALDASGVPYAYLAFEGEGHGFRRQETIAQALEASLYFLARVFDLQLGDEVEPIEIVNLDRAPSAR